MASTIYMEIPVETATIVVSTPALDVSGILAGQNFVGVVDPRSFEGHTSGGFSGEVDGGYTGTVEATP